MEGSGVAGVGFVIAGGDSPELLQLGEGVLDKMAPTVHLPVEADHGLAVGLGWDDRGGTTLIQLRPEPVDVERLVAEQSAEGDTLDQRRHADAVVALAGQQDEAYEVAESVGQVNDLGRQAPPRAADGLGLGPAPCAPRLLVRGDDGAVDQGVFEVRLVGQTPEDALEDAALHPAAEPLEDAVPVAEVARQVAPLCAGPHPPQHRLQEQPVVSGRRTRVGHLAGQQWRDLLPHRVADHEPRPLQHRPNPAKAALESQPVCRGNSECQQALAMRCRLGGRMFFRVKPSGARRYLQLVENTRDGAATRQRVLATLGRVDALETAGKLEALLQSGARFSETALLISSLQDGTLQTPATARIGAPLIFGRLWQQTGCAAVIERFAARRKFGFSLERTIFASVLHR